MLETGLSIHFHLKKRTGYTKGELPVYMRITVNGERKEIGTKFMCDPIRWSKEAQRVRDTNETSKTLNALLDVLERNVHDARLKLMEGNKAIMADMIAKMLTGQEEKPRMLLEVFQQHNDQMTALKGIEFSPSTLKRYETTLEHTRSFILWKYNKPDIEIKDLSFDFAINMEFWLKSVRKCNHNSTMKYIGNLRKIVTYCVKTGWLQKDPFFGFKTGKKEVVRESLAEDELQALTEWVTDFT